MKIKNVVLFKCLGVLGHAWVCLGTLGHAWVCSGMLGHAWSCLVMLGINLDVEMNKFL